MFTKEDIFAVVGASNNPEKYGYRVFKDLLEKGYKVIPVNTHETSILGEKVYSNIEQIDQKIDVVVFVVPPKVTEKVLFDVKNLGIKKVWMQPGSESEKAIKFCDENNIESIHNQCIMFY